MQGGIVLTRESFRVTIQNGGKTCEKLLPLQGQFFEVVTVKSDGTFVKWRNVEKG